MAFRNPRITGGVNLGSGGVEEYYPVNALLTSASSADIVVSVFDDIADSYGMLDLGAGDEVHLLLPNLDDAGVGGIPKSSMHDNQLAVVATSPIFGPTSLMVMTTDTTATSGDVASPSEMNGARAGNSVKVGPAIPSRKFDYLLYSHLDRRAGNYHTKMAFRTLKGVDGINIQATDSQIIIERTITGTTTVNNSKTVTGIGTRFFNEVSVGLRIKVSGTADFARVLAVNSDTELIVDTAIGDGTTQTFDFAAETGADLGVPTMDGGSY